MSAANITLFVDLSLLTAMVVAAITIIRQRDLFAASMLTGFYSLLAASFFVTLDAVDVAFTEAAVGAGFSTVLFLGAIALLDRKQQPGHNHPVLGLLIVAAVGAMLVYGSLDLPAFAAADAPARNNIYTEYVFGSYEKTHIPNMVTTVLASYRGYDTLGEVTVIFTAGVGVAMLLAARRKPKRVARRRKPSPASQPQKTTSK